MGIDARMLLRIKGEKPTDRQIALWGSALCSSIGAKHFFISDGLSQPEYDRASDAWHKAFNAHPDYPAYRRASEDNRWPSARSNDEWRTIGDRIRADIGKAPEQRRRAIELTNYIYPITDDDGIPEEYREPGKCYTQDGDTLFAAKGEWFLTVNLWTRYYGIGYERGDLLALCGIAEWCEFCIANCVVWYGGDSSGCIATPWPDSERLKLRQHLYSPQGRDYFNYSGFAGSSLRPKPCGLCIDNGHFSQFGSGANYIAVHCANCGKSFETRNLGETWTEKKEAA